MFVIKKNCHYIKEQFLLNDCFFSLSDMATVTNMHDCIRRILIVKSKNHVWSIMFFLLCEQVRGFTHDFFFWFMPLKTWGEARVDPWGSHIWNISVFSLWSLPVYIKKNIRRKDEWIQMVCLIDFHRLGLTFDLMFILMNTESWTINGNKS